jgi:hypothetical protein
MDADYVAELNEQVPELMGVKEAAAEIGVLTSNIDKVADLPDPARHIASGRLWRADVIRTFAAERRERLTDGK